MDFRKSICLVSLICILSVQTAFAQDKQFAPIAGSAGVDPFTLTPGSSFTASGSGKRPPANSAVKKETVASDFDEALSIITANHVDAKRKDTEALTGSAIAAMLKTLDPHSNFYNPAEFQELLGEHESEYTGTGSSIAGFERGGRIDTYVISTFPDSPAAKAGLRFGDRILAVDGKPVSGALPDQVRDLVRGKRGTTVRLTIERAARNAVSPSTTGGSIETIEMKRDRVHEPAVPKSFLLGGNTGYIDLTNGFSNATFNEFESALNDLRRQGMQSLVLDLRGNGGGILEQAVKVAEKFLPAGATIVSQRGRYSDDTRTWRAGKQHHESMPLVLLVDEHSASASEVLAGALQDNDRALIVGQKTFGKGLVQSVLNLPDGAGLTLTAARYFTPTGRSIQRDYTDVGLYDYFNHRVAVAEIEKSTYAARTITNRVVYGGDGISPDELAAGVGMTREQIRLLDPIFFFVREFMNRTTGTETRPVNEAFRSGHPAIDLGKPERERGRNTHGGDPKPWPEEETMRRFLSFVEQTDRRKSTIATMIRERAFVQQMLRYYLAMSTAGQTAANRAAIEHDPLVHQATAALPKAARLTAAAQKARLNPKKEKSSLSLVLNEPR